MRLKLTFVIFFLYSNTLLAQYSTSESLFAKEYSKDECLFKSKNFLITEVLGNFSTTANKVEIDALTASNSGELTTVYYKSEDKNKEGLVLGFFGSRWNDAGVIFTSYAFRNLSKDSALLILNKLDETIDANQKYLSEYGSNNERNVYFKFNDLSFIIYFDTAIKIRVLWKDFDASWDYKSFSKTLKRFNSKIK